MDTRQLVDEATKVFTDRGELIAAGWHSLRLQAIPPNASDIQLREMRKAFFAGAQHLYASIMGILDPGSEPTEKDLERMALIDKELRAFVEELKKEMMD